MPQPTLERGSDAVRQPGRPPRQREENLLRHAQKIYRAAYNSAEEQYGEEVRAHRVAWSAVENKYEKNDQGDWVEKNG